MTSKSRALSWQALLGGEVQKETYQEFVVVKPKLDNLHEEPIKLIRTAAQDIGLAADTAGRLRITGEVALAHDELNSAMHGAQDAGLLAFVMVAGGKPFTQEIFPTTISSHWHSYDDAYRIAV